MTRREEEVGPPYKVGRKEKERRKCLSLCTSCYVLCSHACVAKIMKAIRYKTHNIPQNYILHYCYTEMYAQITFKQITQVHTNKLLNVG